MRIEAGSRRALRRRATSLVRRALPLGPIAVTSIFSMAFALASASQAASTLESPDYATGKVCAECHPAEAKAWRGSHHDLAMQVASPATVLGDFAGTRFDYNGVESTFTRRGDRFFVRTDGPDGKLAEFEIKYVFGVDPLQQYLIEFPDGRLQALGIAWDARPAAAGGQRWFHLYPDEHVTAGDGLHWTDPNQNWNHMCAECHSTNLRKDYRLEDDRFETTWSEIDVSCEACHGPGARHVAWARAGGKQGGDPALDIRFEKRGDVKWTPVPNAAGPKRVPERSEHLEVETCARCHARRSTIHPDHRFAQPLLDQHRVALLDEDLYFPDGQIKDEVYVYGSFVQSKMFAAGVTCSDCHDPHSAGLRAEGNALCTRCHEPNRFDTPAHHHHPKDTPGSRCVDCHMPTRTYMVVDPRRDHSLRVPRPDLSDTLGTPNPCIGCHSTMTNRWASRKVDEWRGKRRPVEKHWGEAIHAGRSASADAAERLLALIADPSAPAIARATAITLFPRYAGPRSLPVFERALADPDPLVRSAAVGTFLAIPTQLRAELVPPLLADPIRSVRFEAARVLADVPRMQLSADARAQLDRVLVEYRAAQRMDADRPDAHLRVSTLERMQGHDDRAQAELERAIALDPSFIPAYVNLADLYRATGRDAKGEKILRDALARDPDHPDVHHALGLLLVRLGRVEDALPELLRAAELHPELTRYTFVYAVALHSTGDTPGALKVLRAAAEQHPGDPEIVGLLRQLESEGASPGR